MMGTSPGSVPRYRRCLYWREIPCLSFLVVAKNELKGRLVNVARHRRGRLPSARSPTELRRPTLWPEVIRDFSARQFYKSSVPTFLCKNQVTSVRAPWPLLARCYRNQKAFERRYMCENTVFSMLKNTFCHLFAGMKSNCICYHYIIFILEFSSSKIILLGTF